MLWETLRLLDAAAKKNDFETNFRRLLSMFLHYFVRYMGVIDDESGKWFRRRPSLPSV
jgi:hypothetical protein